MHVYVLWLNVGTFKTMMELYSTHSLAIRGLRKADATLPTVRMGLRDATFSISKVKVIT